MSKVIIHHAGRVEKITQTPKLNNSLSNRSSSRKRRSSKDLSEKNNQATNIAPGFDELIWTYSKSLSIEWKEPIFIHRFPVYKYKNKMSLLDGEFILFQNTGEIKVNVINRSTGNLYAPFYGYKYGDFEDMLKVIHKNIDKEARKIGVKKYGNDYCWEGL